MRLVTSSGIIEDFENNFICIRESQTDMITNHVVVVIAHKQSQMTTGIIIRTILSLRAKLNLSSNDF